MTKAADVVIEMPMPSVDESCGNSGEGAADTSALQAQDTELMALHTAAKLVQELQPLDGDALQTHRLYPEFYLLATRQKANVERALQQLTALASAQAGPGVRDNPGAVLGIATAHLVLHSFTSFFLNQPFSHPLYFNVLCFFFTSEAAVEADPAGQEPAEAPVQVDLAAGGRRLLGTLLAASGRRLHPGNASGSLASGTPSGNRTRHRIAQAGKSEAANHLLRRVLNFNRSCAKAFEYLGYILEKEQSFQVIRTTQKQVNPTKPELEEEQSLPVGRRYSQRNGNEIVVVEHG